METLFAATGNGITRLTAERGRWRAEAVLARAGTRSVAVDPESSARVVAGSHEHGVWLSDDGGETWRDCALPERAVFSVAMSRADGALYAGCEPSMLFRSDDGGVTWRELSALRELPSAPTWSFPPRPWTSHVRWIAPSPHDASLLLVGIELGGLMRSTDGGETWEDHRPGAQRDVHSLAWHPREPGRAYEAAGGGAAWSFDAGATWRPADEGRDRHYTWAVAADEDDPDLWYVSASTGPFAAHGGRNAEVRLYRWEARDGRWFPLGGDGLADPSPTMIYALATADGRVFSGLANGEIVESADRGDSWQPLELFGEPLPALHALAVAR